MSYKIHIEKNNSFLHCKITGDNNLHNVVHYLSDVHDAMVAHKCSNVIIEEHLMGKSLSLLQMYSVIKFAKKTVFSHPHKIAYVDTNPEHNKDNLQLAIMSAVYHFISVRMFHSVEEGIDWLNNF